MIRSRSTIICLLSTAAVCSLSSCIATEGGDALDDQAPPTPQYIKTSCVSGRELELSRRETERLLERAQPEHPVCATLRDPSTGTEIPTALASDRLDPDEYDFVLCDGDVVVETGANGAALKHSWAIQVAVAKDAPGKVPLKLEATCTLSCTGSSCSMSGCDGFGSDCTSFSCSGQGNCTATCTKKAGSN